MKVCVTGAAGRAGRAVVMDLLAHDYDVLATDLYMPPDDGTAMDEVGFMVADLTDYGQAFEVVKGMDAVVHLANIPAPGLRPPAVTFNNNITMNFNVFHAAAERGLARVVWASSETTLGLPFDTPPRFAPIDEDHYPVPTSTYALSKVASETIAEQIAGWSGIPFVALRFSNILGPREYADDFPQCWDHPARRKWNLWGYIDERDAAQSCRRALVADVTGASSYIIAAADTVMTRPSEELLREVYPGVPLKSPVPGTATLLSFDRARQALGFVPEHSWRDHISRDAS
jgi:nucleoside-diphosphate-sugar epimerase